MVSNQTSQGKGGRALSCIGLVLVAGCAEFPAVDATSEEDMGRPIEQVITIAFRNLSTTDTVDVEFHLATTADAELPAALFVDENRVTASLGIAGTGLLIPGATDVLEVPCQPNLVFGSAGGAFLDNETGEATGRGEARWLDAASLGLCGAIVGFTFEARGGTFATDVEIRR